MEDVAAKGGFRAFCKNGPANIAKCKDARHATNFETIIVPAIRVFKLTDPTMAQFLQKAG
ncbi:MAG: hypothetical protein DME26_11075 [Verrucomicrobia bacterium]|nr:MAG: hypothetical protein DME26_11075 [Verrucomicrobiota bacterium]